MAESASTPAADVQVSSQARAGLGALRWWLCLLLIATMGSARAETVPSATASSYPMPVVDYAGPWEYRYGDSPLDAAGRRLWAQPEVAADHTGWQLTNQLSTPPGRNGATFLWLRTRIVPPPGYADTAQKTAASTRRGATAGGDNSLTLFAYNIDESYEAYLDGVLIARFGVLDAPSRTFHGTPRVFLALGQDSAGRMLTLRIHSRYGWIGIFGQPSIGPPGAVVQDVLDRSMSPALIGFFSIFLGLLALILFAARQGEWVYFYYGAFALSAGINLVMRAPARDLVLPPGPFWTYAEVLSPVGVTSALCGYMALVFGPGPRRIVIRLGQALILCTLVGLVLVVSGTVHIWNTLLPMQAGALTLVITVGLVAFFGLRRTHAEGKTDGRILAIGVGLASLIEIFELLMVMGILPRYRLLISHYPVACIVLCLGLILVLRFSRVHRRMQSYGNVMQLSLSAARTLEPGQHIQVALTEVLRLLGGVRVLIFERETESESGTQHRPRGASLQLPADLLGPALWLAAGRDAAGRPIQDSGRDYLDCDTALIADVLRRRRPGILLRERDKIDDSPDQPARRERLSIAAAPLLARGEAFGVLYLESDATQQIYSKEDLEILLGLGSQVALTLMTSRAVRLELESDLARRRLAQQSDLLAAAARMAAGDLQSAIAEPKESELAPLARALEAMRQDLQLKFDKLATSNKEIQQLNDELRRQIENRSQRLMEALLRGTEARKGGQVVPGKLLSEHYLVLNTLGRGAMGAVYEVERVRDKRHFAAKVLSEQGDRMALMRFAREGQILARLDHPNLVGIVDIDITESGTLFLVMELVRGTTLKLCHDRFAEPRKAVPLLRQIADGLGAIHARGIVHRDLKPANVLIAEAGTSGGGEDLPQVKLADFGVSTLLSSIDDTTEGGPPSGRGDGSTPTPKPPRRQSGGPVEGGRGPTAPAPEFETTREQVRLAPDELSGETATMAKGATPTEAPGGLFTSSDAGDTGDVAADGHLTQTGILVGTPMYMAPELSEGSRDARPASDVFSLGVIAYEVLTGEVPFLRPPVWARFRGEVPPAPSLSRKRPDLPRELHTLVDSCLHFDAAERPTATAVATQLLRISESLTRN